MTNYTVPVSASSVAELRSRLQAMRMHIDMRRALGWDPFQPDETWTYNNQNDARVCPICDLLGILNVLSGQQILDELKGQATYIPSAFYLARPNTHLAYPQFRGECRCWMSMNNPAETLALRLAKELEVYA